MSTVKVSFNCAPALVETLDRMATKDHRDRTSMLHKIIAYYLENNPAQAAPTPNKKKAGAR